MTTPPAIRAPRRAQPDPARRKRRWRWIAAISAMFLLVAGACIFVVITHAQSILRLRVVETLSARFKSRVELANLHVWIADGLHVDGGGLKIFGATDPNPWAPGVQPLFEIGTFRFQTSLGSLFREPMHVDTVFIDGLILNIPPASQRQQVGNLRKRSGKISITVDKFECVNTKIIVNTQNPNKAPLEFDIGSLHMKDIGPGQPLRFDATLVNPKPVGDIHSVGEFGPFQEGSPRDSAVAGDYSFTHADLGTIKGIGGMLSSTGKYSGTLGRISVDGETDTPDFRLALNGRSVPLHTRFHAIVDGTDGDTHLDPVNATMLRSSFSARGKIVRVPNVHGHDIELNVVLDRAYVEDLLTLAVKSDPPIMSGPVSMHANLSLPPGEGDTIQRLNLAGEFHIAGARFSNQKVQSRINSLSVRSQGKPQLVRQSAELDVPSDINGTFKLRAGVLDFSALHFVIPGTRAEVAGLYSLDGNTFDFHGAVRLDAHLSQMTTGWKSILLKPVDPFFAKHGAGAEVPFKITGVHDEPHFGLDFHRKANANKEGSVALK